VTASPSYAHLSVLPAAVEAAQRTASEYVAQALAAADAAGYARGLAAAPPAAPVAALPPDVAALLALLATAAETADEVEAAGRTVDSLCDDVAPTSGRKRGRRSTITVPDTGDSFGDVESFLADHGGNELVDPDEIEIDVDDLRNMQSVLADHATALRETLDALRALLMPAAATEGETPEGETTEAA
jgi:hypothetical protein